MSGPLLTRALSVWDYRKGNLTKFCVPFEPDQEQLAESLLFLRKKYALRVPAGTVEAGDIVTLRCRSGRPKFQKDSVTVNVGKNLYSKELESQLPGFALEDERKLSVQGEAVSVRVLKIERTVLPELTDEFVKKAFEDLSSVKELKDRCINDQFENHLKGLAAQAAEKLKAQALDRSEFHVDEAERQEARASGEQALRDMWAFNGRPLDRISDGEASELLGYPTVQAYIDWFAGLSEEDLLCAALGWELLSAEGGEPTEDCYREAVRKMTEEEGVSPENLKDYTLSTYVRQTCAEYYQDTLNDYAYQTIKEKLA